MVTATGGLSLLGMLVASALGREASLRPKTVLTDNLFHALKPLQIIGVVIWEIKRLWLTVPVEGLTPSHMRGPFR